MFSEDMKAVALIRKNRPEWQAGKLNGVGGKIEPNEDFSAAMVREFREEAGRETTMDQWRHYGQMIGMNDDNEGAFKCQIFASTMPGAAIYRLKGQESEQIEIISIEKLCENEMIENLHWLILLALDHLDDGRPTFVDIGYK